MANLKHSSFATSVVSNLKLLEDRGMV